MTIEKAQFLINKIKEDLEVKGEYHSKRQFANTIESEYSEREEREERQQAEYEQRCWDNR